MLDPRNEPENNSHHTFDPFRTINDRSDSWRSGSFGARARKTGENYQKYWNFNGDGVQFRPQNSEDESGTQSPPLWTSSPTRSPPNSWYNPNTYRSLSPASRTQAIARGQRELMEMVKNMPESCYELSLKDLVEHPRIESPKEESYLLEEKKYDDHHEVLNQRVKSIRRQESKNNSNNSEKKAQILRSGSMENRDLFLKMVFPVSFKSRKKKNLMTNTLAKVSPKPEGSDKTSRNVDKDWWVKRFSSSSESDSGRTSSHGGSSGSSGSNSSSSRSNSGRKKRGFLASCFSCFYSTKSKSPEEKGRVQF